MGSFEVWQNAFKDYGPGARYASQGDLSKACGLPQTMVSRWVNGMNIQNIKGALDASDRLGCSMIAPNQGLGNDFKLVPKVAAKCGAGGSLETSSDILSMHAFRTAFFNRMGIHARSAVMMDVIGDSMEPTIYEGDTVLIDQSDKDLREGRIYVVTLGDELKVKRIQKSVSGITLISDNKELYEPVVIPRNELETLIVHGRVRWVGRVF